MEVMKTIRDSILLSLSILIFILCYKIDKNIDDLVKSKSTDIVFKGWK
jgi:hypothetical protein